MINPYENVDWANDKQIITTTHDHVYDPHVSTSTKQHFENLYNGGVRCFAISNYYPSAPMYPLSDWTNELGILIPEDIIEIPNAEQHHLSFFGGFGNSIHMNSLGSLFRAGNPKGVSPVGYNGKIEDLIKEVKSQLLYSNGGGITINHPTWTYNQNLFSMDILTKILDIDEIVLGIEIFSSQTWNVYLWDQILNSGRRCWGFAVPDHYHKSHSVWYGRNVLVVPILTQQECLKAFRNGNMYCKYSNTDLKFTNISLINNTLTVETNLNSLIKFISNGITIQENPETTTASCELNDLMLYIRIEASTEADRILSQPLMLSTQMRKRQIKNNNWKWL